MASLLVEDAHPASGWPALTWEEIPWGVNPSTGMPRQDRSWIGRPYRAAVPAAIADLTFTLSAPVAAEADDAARALSEFDTQLGHEIAPYASVLLRSESASSSQIEQLSASARKIAEAEVNGSGTEHATMIVGNAEAMRAALALADRLDSAAVLAMHEALMRRSDGDIAGHWRTDQVWIGGPTPHTAAFVPPTQDRVPRAVDDVLAFAGRDDLPALPQIALAHAQFETIHPFPDGNGRTGRALLHAMLRAKGVTKHVSVPVSSGLLARKDDYIAALGAYREGDIEPIVSVLARASLAGVANGRALVDDLNAVRSVWAERLDGMRAHSGAHRLAEELISHPVVSARLVSELLATANPDRLIDALVRRGILVGSTDHKRRNRTWRAPDVLAALDRYAARSGRRI